MTAAIDTLDAVLAAHAEALGGDLVPYRNHAYRVVTFCIALSAERPDRGEKVAIAAAFHDLGIWTARTFDYLAPSVELAEAWLREHGRESWMPEIEAMILQHHKIRPWRGNQDWLVEPFRRADWIDVTRGTLRYGVSRTRIRQAYSEWPAAGFHKRLVRFSFDRVRTHPASPLPMLRW